VYELYAGGVQSRWVAQLRERHERSGDLRGRIDPLRWVDPDGQPIDESVELALRQSPQDVGESMARGGCA
jgi:hypothetical protein